MTSKINKLLKKPEAVANKDDGVYFVILFISVLGIFTTSLIFLLAVLTNNTPLVWLNVFGLLVSLYVCNLNRKGKHLIAISLYCACLYLYSVNGTIIYSWKSGFQYYLIPLTTLLFLLPNFKNKYLVAFGIFPFFTFLFLYPYTSEVLIEQQELFLFLHAYNAFNVFLALAFINYYFRTSVFRLLKSLDKNSKTDVLTGLMNRRFMTTELSRYCNITERYDNTNSILLIDIDKFKHINDQLGHAAGDAILKQFASLLTLRLRESDLLARWGGDEFLLLAPFTNLKSAGELAESLREAVQLHDFHFEQKLLNISITIGVNELIADQGLESSLKKVDQLLYQGKNNGRGQVVSQDILETQL